MQITDLLVVDSLDPKVVGGGAVVTSPSPAMLTLKEIHENLSKRERKYRAAKAPATLKAVRADWHGFLDWGDRNGRWALPAAADDLRQFLDDMVVLGRKRPTLARYINTIRLIHAGAKLPDPTHGPEWKLEWQALVRRLRDLGATAPRQAQPLASSGVRTILASLGDKPIDLRDAALISLASDTLCRESELVRLQREDIQPNGKAFTVDLRWNKTDQEGLGSSRYCSRETKARIDAWCTRAGIKKGPIFLPIGWNRLLPEPNSAPLKPAEVARIFRRRAIAAGLADGPVISGHSTRVGSAVELLEFGQSPTSVQFAGGWKSQRMVLHYGQRALAGQNAMATLREENPLTDDD